MSPATQLVRAGALQAQFEHGSLRNIRYGRYEVIRSLYFALRDQNWGTVPYRIDDFNGTADDTAFAIRFIAVHSVDEQDVYRWTVRIEGTVDSSIDFRIEGITLQSFWRNRAGFCILHPIDECAGKPVQITQPDGTLTETVFPKLISPDRPFPYIRVMQWAVEPGVTAQLRVEGDDFETEDQRNWTDGSYKTFCTPLAKPFPVELRAGDTVRQEIRLSLTATKGLRVNAGQPNGVLITLHDERTPLPRIGTQQSFGRAPLPGAAADRLRTLHLDHYRTEIDLSEPNWQGLLREADRQARCINAPLLVSLTFGNNPVEQVRAFLTEIRANPVPIADLIVFQQGTYATPTSLLETVRPLLQNVLPPNVRIGAGTQTNYTELGRNVFTPDGLAFVSYGIQPQEHAFDDASLVENLEAQADTVRSARALYSNQAVYVSPLTLRKRYNPYSRNLPDRFVEQPLSVQTDERQVTAFGAAWLLGSLKTIAEAGADAITVFRATGDLGLMTTDGQPYPAFEVVRAVQAFRGGRVRRTCCSDKLVCSSLWLENGAERCLIVANHTSEPQSVKITGSELALPLSAYQIRYLHNAELGSL